MHGMPGSYCLHEVPSFEKLIKWDDAVHSETYSNHFQMFQTDTKNR